MVDTKPLLKGFGAAADVAGQIATDKAVNGRRATDITSGLVISAAELASTNAGYTSRVRTSVNPANGQIVQNVETETPLTTVDHDLGRIPDGAYVIGSDTFGIFIFDKGTADSSTFKINTSTVGAFIDIWVF